MATTANNPVGIEMEKTRTPATATGKKPLMIWVKKPDRLEWAPTHTLGDAEGSLPGPLLLDETSAAIAE